MCRVKRPTEIQLVDAQPLICGDQSRDVYHSVFEGREFVQFPLPGLQNLSANFFFLTEIEIFWDSFPSTNRCNCSLTSKKHTLRIDWHRAP